MSLSTRQLALIPESALKRRILSAAGVEIPSEAVSTKFDLRPEADKALYYWDQSEGPDPIFVLHEGTETRLVRAAEILKDRSVPASGTPTGDAVRAYLRRWGWLPKSEREALDPTADTKTIV